MTSNVLFGDWHGTPRGDAEDAVYTVTPIGDPCGFCGVPIRKGDVGEMMPFDFAIELPVHRECVLKAVLPPEMIEKLNRDGKL